MSGDEVTCIMVKPDGVGARHVGGVIARLESEGFRLTAMKMVRPTAELMGGFYAEHKGKPFYEGLVKFITSGPLVVMAWRGTDIVARVRRLIGATNPKAAEPGTLRAQWGTDNRRNLVHASDSPASGERETGYWFTPAELAPYDPDRWAQPDMAPPAP
jgi:nucleoside-diphosphate kinase